MAKHSLDFWLTSEDLPDPNNRVTINDEGEIVLAYKPNNEEGHKRLIAKLKHLLKENPGEDAGFVIADLIIERQLQKIKSRKETKKDNHIPDDEKW